jgi:alpha-glucosidase
MSRAPMPWDRAAEPAYAARIALYRDMLRLRREHPVLATGGPYSAVAASAPGSSTAGIVASAAPREASTSTLSSALSRTMRVRAAGTAFAAWALPGVTAPPSRAAETEATPEAFAQLGSSATASA